MEYWWNSRRLRTYLTRKKYMYFSTGFQNFSVHGKICGRGAVKGCPRGVRAVARPRSPRGAARCRLESAVPLLPPKRHFERTQFWRTGKNRKWAKRILSSFVVGRTRSLTVISPREKNMGNKKYPMRDYRNKNST